MPSSGVQTGALRSEEHTSELQSHDNLVCRLLLGKRGDTETLLARLRGAVGRGGGLVAGARPAPLPPAQPPAALDARPRLRQAPPRPFFLSPRPPGRSHLLPSRRPSGS